MTSMPAAKSRRNSTHTPKPANAPVRRPGEKVVNKDSYKRTQPILGIADSKMLRIKITVERDDPSNTGRKLRRVAVWKFGHSMNFNDLEDIKKLKQWRNQVFFRVLGRVRDARLPWLEVERDFVLYILKKHLKTEAVGGRWSMIKWNEIATKLNNKFGGQEQAAGLMTAPRAYRADTNGVTSKAMVLKKARVGPVRSAGSLLSAVKNFESDLAKKIVMDAKKADDIARAGNSDSEGNEADDDTTDDTTINSTIPSNGAAKGEHTMDDATMEVEQDTGANIADYRGTLVIGDGVPGSGTGGVKVEEDTIVVVV